MRIDSAGNVGIGTSADATSETVLHIKSDVNNELNNGIRFEAADSTHKFRGVKYSTGEVTVRVHLAKTCLKSMTRFANGNGV